MNHTIQFEILNKLLSNLKSNPKIKACYHTPKEPVEYVSSDYKIAIINLYRRDDILNTATDVRIQYVGCTDTIHVIKLHLAKELGFDSVERVGFSLHDLDYEEQIIDFLNMIANA